MPTDDDLTAFLQSQTSWRGQSPEVFRKALDAAPEIQAAPRRRDILATIRRPALAALAAVIVVALTVGMFMPALGKARNSSRVLRDRQENAASMDASAARRGIVLGGLEELKSDHESRMAAVPSAAHEPSARYAPAQSPTPDAAERHFQTWAAGTQQPTATTEGVPSAAPSSSRLVIRKATLELLTPDVRAAFGKAQHLLRADLDEYAEASNLTGENETARAQLTLRVVASRLDTVLNDLRALGTIQSENATGDDVTTQAVDLEARLRNERRVEIEIQQLLETRKDAPLKEILDLRDKLAEIRQSIETMQARRDTLGRQVDLATILLLIRADAKPAAAPEVEKHSFFDQLATRLGAAADSGAHSLTASLAFILQLLIAGAFWWLILLIAIIALRRHLALRPKVSI